MYLEYLILRIYMMGHLEWISIGLTLRFLGLGPTRTIIDRGSEKAMIR